jgi:iron complex outermembrane receptor protein
MLHSSMDLPKNVEFDANGRYVDRLQNQDIDGYFALDLRLGWRPTKNWELAVVGQNLLDAYHPEYRGEVFSTVLSQVERSVYAKVTWLF